MNLKELENISFDTVKSIDGREVRKSRFKYLIRFI